MTSAPIRVLVARLASGADFAPRRRGSARAAAGARQRSYALRRATGEDPPLRYILPPGALNRASEGGTHGQETP